MNPGTHLLEVRGARASSVIVQRIPTDVVNVFMDWQRGVTAAAAEFPGYQTTEIYPASSQDNEWVVIIHFDDAAALQNWLDSPKRSEWVVKLPSEVRDFKLKTLPSGFGAWFAGLPDSGQPLPHWKMALAVLFGLYPTVMLLSMFLFPHTERLGLAVAFLINNVVSVCFLEWLGMPVISRLLGPWLRANGPAERTQSLLGMSLLFGALALMTFLFNLVN